MPRLTVITLTRNRLARLLRCLERLLPQLAEGDEVVLVDTGSTDGTREHFKNDAPEGVRFFAHDAKGSWAEVRNFGVAQARGEFIAFLDDDCLPATDWVERGKAGLMDADAVGGIARPLGIRQFPGWWHPEMGWMVGLSVPGHAGPDAGRIHYPMTANVWARAGACRAVPFQEVGGKLGTPEGGGYDAGREDAQWWRALRVSGYRTRFDPKLLVGHGIDPNRIDLEYLARRAAQDGRAWARREGTAEDREPLAYQWWQQWLAQAGALWAEAGSRRAHWHYHRLVRLRHWMAMEALAGKKAPPLHGWFWRAGWQWGSDRGRTVVRNAMRPWLRARPELGPEEQCERLAVVAFGFLGDLVILQSALRGLVKAYPHLTVYVMGPPAARVAIGSVQRVVISAPPEFTPGSPDSVTWMNIWLHDVQPDAIIAPYLHEPWGRSLTSIRRPLRPVVGFDVDQGLKHLRFLERLSVRVHKSLEHHELDNLLALLRVAGLPCEAQAAQIEPEAAAVTKAREHEWFSGRAMGGRGEIVMFNPDAGHAQKEWDDAKWAELAGRVLDETPWRIAINASRARPELERLVETLSPAGRVHWLREAGLKELVAWMSLTRGLVTVDSGPQHLAHGLGVPSVTLYGPMDERRWGDYWKRGIHKTVRGCTFDLTPEERRGLAENSMMGLVETNTVFDELRRLISG